MKTPTQYALITLLAVLAGCSTGYKSDGFMSYSGGYSQTQLAENMFEVNFKGNGYTSAEKAKDFALLRSAELTLEHGFSYFQIISAASGMRESSHTTPVQAYTTHHAYGSNTSFTGGQTTTTVKPSSSNTVLMLHDKPENGAIAFEAAFLVQSIKTKYKLK